MYFVWSVSGEQYELARAEDRLLSPSEGVYEGHGLSVEAAETLRVSVEANGRVAWCEHE